MQPGAAGRVGAAHPVVTDLDHEDAGGVPGYGNQRSEWNAGTRFDFENPEYR